MSEAEREPTPLDPAATDTGQVAQQDAQAWNELGDAELGEALGDALADVASVVADEALAEADQPRRRKKRSSPGKHASGSRWARLDGTMAIVLFTNLMFMGLVLFLPDPVKTPIEPIPEAGPEITQAPTGPKVESGPQVTPPMESRVVQLAEIERLVRTGRFTEAIAMIEESLRANPDLPPVVRRSLYSRLANYCAEAGNHDKALQYLKLASNGFQMSLLPKDLWKMGQDASQLGDQSGARKYLARFLLQESLMGEEMQSKIPDAYLRLGDGYRIQAAEAERAGGSK